MKLRVLTLLFIFSFLLTACKETSAAETALASSSNSEANISGADVAVSDTENAEAFDIQVNGDKYMAQIKNSTLFTEFSDKNSGVVNYNKADDTLWFSMTKHTGTVTGGMDGPRVQCRINCDTWELTEKKFSPEPDYNNPGKSTENYLEMSDERLIEICKELQSKLLTGG